MVVVVVVVVAMVAVVDVVDGWCVVGGGWVVVAAAPVQRPQSHSKPQGTKVSLPPWAKERR